MLLIFTLFIVHTIKILQYTSTFNMYNVPVHYTMYTVQCTLYNIHCTMYTVQYTLYNVQCTMYTVQYTMYNVHCTIYTVQCTMYSVQCTMYGVYCQSPECIGDFMLYSLVVQYSSVVVKQCQNRSLTI